jgi:MoxR-like ATPase
MTVKPKIKILLSKLNEGIIEKEEVIALSLLSTIAGESIFLLGAPGVAKSLVARKLKYTFKDGSSFEYLMNRFSTPDEIFGPVSISQLKDNDKYERITKNYLPEATVVFLDEIWKAGPSIQNSLLTVLNEKIYRNGDKEIKVPMKALISASNELPTKGEGLEALWDRFLIRIIVKGVKDKNAFNNMISKSLNSYTNTIGEALKITDEEYEKWSKQIDEIEIPENVFNVIHVIRSYIENYNNKEENLHNPIYISDRRWRKIVRLLRTSAFLNDRKQVDLMDCFLIKYCIWNEVEQIEATSQFVRDAIQKYGYSIKLNFNGLKEELKEFEIEIEEETKFVKDTRSDELVIEKGDYFEILNLNNKSNLIRQIDLLSLTNNNENINLYYWDNSWKQVRNDRYTYEIRNGNSEHSIFVDDVEYQLKTKISGEKRITTRKPNKKIEEDWDNRVSTYLRSLINYRKEIEDYKSSDLQHLRTNLFVSPEMANIVEAHLDLTFKEIEKLEIKLKKIKNDYKKLKDEVINIE